MKKARPILIFLFLLAFPAWAGEKPVPKDFYDLSKEDVLEWRALEAEMRAIRAESTMALREREAERAKILEKWRVLVGEEDLTGWQVDLEAKKLRKRP